MAGKQGRTPADNRIKDDDNINEKGQDDMLRALFTAVTGVRAHQTMLDVTGNNIANVNTTGFKKDNTIFADLMYQSSKYASGSGDDRGGINPAQVGLGVSVSAIETIHTQGSSQYTGNAADMMIQDAGFFVYREGNTQLYSRSGALTLDSNSDMVMSGTGYKLQGYQYENTPLEGYKQASSLSTVNIPLGQKIAANATSRIDYQCNLDSTTNAYLSYGFADLPYNVTAGWQGNSSGTARISMQGTTYDMSFETDLSWGSNPTSNVDNSGINYLNINIANGDTKTRLTLDMTGVDADSGLPRLSLPKINIATTDANGVAQTYSYTYAASATSGANSNSTSEEVFGSVEGWLDESMNFIDSDDVGDLAAGLTQSQLDKYIPVYRFPGQTPPTYFAAQYDDSTGSLRIRSITLLDANGEEVSGTNFGLKSDIDDGTVATVKANPAIFTYNIKSNMKYTSFQLSGSPTVRYTTTDANGVVTEAANSPEPHKVSYNFLVEFDESVDRSNSELSKTAAPVTLWYYGISNADAEAGIANATARMHKLEATAYFAADGTFDSIEWRDTTNDNAPQGYRIVDGPIIGGNDNVKANFRITPSTSSSAISTRDTLLFQTAQNLDAPSESGQWNAAGTLTQGGHHSTKVTIYDDNGKEHTLEVTFKKITENRWRWEAFLVEKDEDSGEDVLSSIVPSPSSGEIEFDGSGRISNVVDSSGENRRGDGNDRYPNAEVEISIPFSLNGQRNSVITLNFGGGVGSGGSALDGVTQFASETTTKPVYQDGYTMGVLKSYSVAENGTITGKYDNGVNIPLYRVALATFKNEQGLEKVGNTMFEATVNSGNANIDGATTNGKGKIMSQYLEMSNVDLTEEFTHLIIAQRGFQANTRVITTSDQILEEVVNLKR